VGQTGTVRPPWRRKQLSPEIRSRGSLTSNLGMIARVPDDKGGGMGGMGMGI
jgi:hypothetical protein